MTETTPADASLFFPTFQSRGFELETRAGRPAPIVGKSGTDAEIRRATERCAFFDRSTEAGVFFIRGSDRAKVLHGQCTQDVKGAAVGFGGAAWLLDAKGVNHGSLRFTILDDEIRCETEASELEPTVKRLSRFIISEDARVETPPHAPSILRVVGPESRPALAAALNLPSAPAEEYAAFVVVRRDVRHFVVRDDASGLGFDVAIDGKGAAAAAAATALVEGLLARGAEPIGLRAAEALRVSAGRARYGVDVGPEFLPAETGSLARTTSFTKGCYSGQEVVAKQRYLGAVRRLVVKLVATDPIARDVSKGAVLKSADGVDAGIATSVASKPDGGVVALAALKPSFATSGVVVLAANGARFRVEAQAS
jgi:tRNA-modifying protein YgfZ